MICLIRVHVGIGQCCRARDAESPALQAKNRARNVPSGRWNVTHVGSIRVGKLTSCHANTWRRSANQWGDGTWVWVRFGAKLTEACHDTRPAVSIPLGRWKRYAWVQLGAKTHPALPQHTANSELTTGAMEEMTGQGQKSSTHELCCHGYCSFQS